MASAMSPELEKKIQALLDEAQGGTLVRSMESLYGLLVDSKLMYRQRIPSTFVGVHPLNRDGCGVSTRHIADLTRDLLQLGWSASQFQGICVEVPPVDSAAVLTFNQNLVEQSLGKLAPVSPETMKFATLAGSHTNQVLRCFLNGTLSDVSEVCTEGRLDMMKLQAKDGAFHDACLNGVTWRVVSRQVVERFPAFCKLAQSAANASGHIAREETELQLCRKIFRVLETKAAAGKSDCTFQDVKEEVLRSRPRNSGTVPWLFAFTARFSGGSQGHFLDETDQFVRAHGYASRSLGPEVYEALSADLRGAEQRVLVRHMLLRFAYTSQDNRALSVSDVKRALAPSMAAKVKEMESAYLRVKDLAEQGQVPATLRLEALGFLQADLVGVLLDKKKHKKHESMEAACNHWAEKLASKSGTVLSLPFVIPDPQAPPKPAASSKRDDAGPTFKPSGWSEIRKYMHTHVRIYIHFYIYI